MEDLSRDELIFLVRRLRQIVDVREYEIETLEGDLDAARKQLMTAQGRPRPPTTLPAREPLVFKPREQLGSRPKETRPAR